MRKIPTNFSLRISHFVFDVFWNKSLKQLQIGIGKRYFYTSTTDEKGNSNGYKFFEIKLR